MELVHLTLQPLLLMVNPVEDSLAGVQMDLSGITLLTIVLTLMNVLLVPTLATEMLVLSVSMPMVLSTVPARLVSLMRLSCPNSCKMMVAT